VDTYQAIISKRDTRSFTEQPIPPDIQRRIVQSGRMAGSSKNSQPCRFIIIDDKKVMEDVAGCGDFAAWIPTSPLLVAVAVNVDAPRGEYDAGRASQNMMVAAWAEGVSSCPVSMHHVDCAREALGLPENYRLAIVVAFGYKAKEQKSVPEAARRPFTEYVSRNRWE
jgi:nitroreductase